MKKPATTLLEVRTLELKDGSKIRALIASDNQSREALQQLGLKNGETISVIVKKTRNIMNWRLAHGLGGFLAANTDDYSGMDAHAVIKKVQTDSGIGCDESTINIPGLGIAKIYVPKTLAFDQMDDVEFRQYWDGGNGMGGWVGWLRQGKFQLFDQMTLAEVERMLVGGNHSGI